MLVQDYHLSLVAARLADAAARPAPACTSATPRSRRPCGCGCSPTAAARELLEGMAAHHACGFHTQRWADDFTRLGPRARRPRADDLRVARSRPTPTTSGGVAASPACAAALAELDARRRRPAGDRPGRPHGAVEEPRCAASSPSTSCSSSTRSTAAAWCSWPSPTPPARACPRYPAYREEIERTRAARSTSGGAPTTGSRSCSTVEDDFPALGRRSCAGPTCCS